MREGVRKRVREGEGRGGGEREERERRGGRREVRTASLQRSPQVKSFRLEQEPIKKVCFYSLFT